MANCRSCGAEIEWLKTQKGKSIPVNKEPVWVEGTNGPIQCYRVHFETCPYANQHRVQGQQPQQQRPAQADPFAGPNRPAPQQREQQGNPVMGGPPAHHNDVPPPNEEPELPF